MSYLISLWKVTMWMWWKWGNRHFCQEKSLKDPGNKFLLEILQEKKLVKNISLVINKGRKKKEKKGKKLNKRTKETNPQGTAVVQKTPQN